MPSQTFSGAAGWYQFIVPANVESVFVTVKGAGGGGDGGRGGLAKGRIYINAGQTLWLSLGQRGLAADRLSREGGGGGGGAGATFGSSGGGASFIRRGSKTGTILIVAGGGGGGSGDGGVGGDGGGLTAGSGGEGTAGSGLISNATGGTQVQPGKGGESSSGVQFTGFNGSGGNLGIGGPGGNGTASAGHGGGGGGGGWRSGGGGVGSNPGFTPGGGGGGGSNYLGGVIDDVSVQGGGSDPGVSGEITIQWVGNTNPPSAPSDVQIDGKPEQDQLPTKSTGSVEISAKINDPDNDERVRLRVRWSAQSDFSSWKERETALGPRDRRAAVTLENLEKNTRYYVRLWTVDENGVRSNTYNSANFWTNRTATATQILPEENASIPVLLPVTFKWSVSDPDPNDGQTGFSIRWRPVETENTLASGTRSSEDAWFYNPDLHLITRAGSSTESETTWTTMTKTGVTVKEWTVNPLTFKGNTFYEWQIRIRDEQNQWGLWSPLRGFFAESVATPPRLISPINDEAQVVTDDVTFRWRFLDPRAGESQINADIRWRVVGTDPWFTTLGDEVNPGSEGFWTFPAGNFQSGYRYEWQVRTYNSESLLSDWSDEETFWVVGTPGSAVNDPPVPENATVQGSLGCGSYRVFIYERGGERMIGEIDPISLLNFSRVRDDISTADVTVTQYGEECCVLLASLRSWIHEIVIFRDGKRVWEGPVTRITYETHQVQIHAQDCMAYLYRRILKQGYNDSYQMVNGVQVGLKSVIERAKRIILNALGPEDPNLIPYLTPITFPNDAKESRVVPDYSRTAWEEIDDMAATAGLDYTTIGRRIILWDTHRPIGLLPEMRDGDFSSPPIVTEYGMLLSTYYAVTNGSGVWGAVGVEDIGLDPSAYGPIELLSSAYGESAAAPQEALTPAARRALVETLEDQAARGINGRFPTPVVVRVPDNSSLSPDVGVGFDQLIPGVHIPLRSEGTARIVAQVQKLDSINVTFDSRGETITVVMSPAPDETQDFDADPTEGEAV